MPDRSVSRPPKYRHDKPRNLAVVRINGQDRYLGSMISRFEDAIEKTGEVNWGDGLLSFDPTRPSRRSNRGRSF